jgi:predicted alpha-1,2-mannosidase
VLTRIGRAAAAVSVLVAALFVAPGPASADGGNRDRHVDLFVGAGGVPPWSSGNTNPAASRPFGMVQLGPDTTADPHGAPSRGASGYRADDPLLRGFSATHLSGAGCPTFGDVPILPVVGPRPADPSAATVGLVKRTEHAAPGRYDVRLANRVATSMAAADRSGLVRFAFGGNGKARVLVKADASLAGTSASSVDVLNRREIAVRATSGGFCGSPNRYRVYVLLRFDEPFGKHGTWRGSHGGAWVNVDKDRVAKIQVGVSFVSIRGARTNLEDDRPGWSIGQLGSRATAAWADTLDRVRAAGGTATERRLFDTALYRVFQHPSTISDADGRYPGFDGKVHRLRDGERQLSSISGWDYYRTQAPLLSWVRPDISAQVVRSLLRDARQGGRIPKWPLVAIETHIMNGDSAAPIIASSYAFGARDFDLDEAVARLVRQGDAVRSEHGFEPRPGLADYLSRGYVRDPVVERGQPLSHGGSTTLEYAVDDFAVSRLATAAGQHRVAARYRERSGSWRALLDQSRDQLVARDSTGAFPPPEVDATACCPGFEEGNPLQYTWGGAPQDVGGLLRALGTSGEVAARLDTFFEQLNAGGGPHAWLGNEPSFATPWDYYWIGRPARTQDIVTRARRELWSTGPEGLPGNDDLGALSAWYVWASMGLYPVTPGTATVAIGVPAFTRVTVRSTRGGVTRIVRTGSGSHVSGVTLDGVARHSTWLALTSRRSLRRISISTSPASQPPWGTDASDAPPSYPVG